MTEQDREEFVKWFPAGRELLEYPNSGDAPTGFKAGWQAAAAYYAPKLTERAVRLVISKAIWDDNSEGRVLSRVLEALRAAGVRFRDEA